MPLSDPPYLAFPLRVGADGGVLASRSRHVRDQIEQVLFTSPRERVFRPQFGVGIRRLVFEPNNAALMNFTRKQLVSSLSEALYGEVDPQTLDVTIEQQDGELLIHISYMLAAINAGENQTFRVTGAG